MNFDLVFGVFVGGITGVLFIFATSRRSKPLPTVGRFSVPRLEVLAGRVRCRREACMRGDTEAVESPRFRDSLEEMGKMLREVDVTRIDVNGLSVRCVKDYDSDARESFHRLEVEFSTE